MEDTEEVIEEEQIEEIETVDPEIEEEIETDDKTSTVDKPDALEGLASEMGWIPPKDDSKDIIDDARTFIKNTVDINKKQRVTIDRLENNIDTIKRDVKKTMEHQTKTAHQEIELTGRF